MACVQGPQATQDSVLRQRLAHHHAAVIGFVPRTVFDKAIAALLIPFDQLGRRFGGIESQLGDALRKAIFLDMFE